MKKEITEFSFDTIENFDDHINLSIQNYSGLIEHIKNIGTYFIKDNSIVYDIGCSTGKLIDILKSHNENRQNVKYIGIDKSSNLTKDNSDIINMDLKDWESKPFSFGLSIFTLQFLDIKLRKKVLVELYKNLIPGGALIISEKIFMEDSIVQDVMNFAHYDFKRKSFSSEDILSKQVDLRYIMKPLKESQNIKLFKETGFNTIEPIWQSLNFKAWLLIKEVV
jgi:tRNA (cmo5U34)-methyltransferase